MNIIKKNYKFIITLILILLTFNIQFPYYIDAPGGISNISSKIEMEGYPEEGSFNLVYVKEYNATIPTLLISLFNKDYKILKKEEVLLNNEDNKDYELRDKIFLKESISNAIYVANKYANKKINIISTSLFVTYIDNIAETNLTVGDEIVSVNGIEVKTKLDVSNIIDDLNIGDKLSIKLKNGNQKYAYIKELNEEKRIGILLNSINEYETQTNIYVKNKNNESGSSGGLATALYIYNKLVKEDITNGLKIVVTGTIDLDGNVGSIGGIEYKLKSAVKNKADLFIVPKDENYYEVKKLKKENNYDIKIVGVSTFEEVINYLKNY